MASARKSLLALGLIALVGRTVGVVAQDRPQITVMVYNRSGMRTPTLVEGERVAQAALRRASVESRWINCLLSSPAHSECQRPPLPLSRLILTVVPNWADRAIDPDALGFAVQVDHGWGSYGYIFQERLDALAAASHISPARLLGNAMAHEIGHLLKGSNSHSALGIMAGHWYANDLQAAGMGSLRFTVEDEAVIRNSLAQNASISK